MKRLLLILIMVMLCATWSSTKNTTKVQISGPEKSYNSVRVTNLTHFANFTCMVYILEEKDGKYVVQSTVGSFQLKEKGDSDKNSVTVNAGQWLGVSLPDEMAGVTVNLSYKDKSLLKVLKFENVNIILTEGGAVQEGEEF